MKALLLIIIFVLVIGGAGLALDKQFPRWGIKAKVTNLIKPSSIKTANTSNTPVKAKQGNIMYRWQDEQGQWHFGENPPAQVNASPIQIKKGNTYDDGEKSTEIEQGNTSKEKPVLFPQFSPGY